MDRRNNRAMIGLGAITALIGAAILGCGIKNNRELKDRVEDLRRAIQTATTSIRWARDDKWQLGENGKAAMKILRVRLESNQSNDWVLHRIEVACDEITRIARSGNKEDLEKYLKRIAEGGIL